MDSPEYSSLLFNIPNTTHLPETLREVVNPTLQQIPTLCPHQAAMQEYARLQNIQLPNPETEAAAITRAIFNVLTSPSSSSSSQQPHTNLPYSHQVVSKFSAFKRYALPLGPRTTQVRANLGRQSMMKRSFAFFRSLNYSRFSARIQANCPTTTQLHHMISERKRREKLNESFQALRSLLPPGTKVTITLNWKHISIWQCIKFRSPFVLVTSRFASLAKTLIVHVHYSVLSIGFASLKKKYTLAFTYSCIYMCVCVYARAIAYQYITPTLTNMFWI